jgi:hypothetical protein
MGLCILRGGLNGKMFFLPPTLLTPDEGYSTGKGFQESRHSIVEFAHCNVGSQGTMDVDSQIQAVALCNSKKGSLTASQPRLPQQSGASLTGRGLSQENKSCMGQLSPPPTKRRQGRLSAVRAREAAASLDLS